MSVRDILWLAFTNVWRNRSRSILTLLGVAVGVAALVTLLAYGSGLQKNARGEFETLELYNTLRVTSRPNPIEGVSDIAFRNRQQQDEDKPEIPVTDSLLSEIARIPGILAAYPEVVFPVRIQVDNGMREVLGNAEGIPLSFSRFPAYTPEHGAFFETEQDTALLMSTAMAGRLGFDPPESIVGQQVEMVTATLNLAAAQMMASAFMMGAGALPLQEHRHRVTVAGLLDDDGQQVSGFVRVLVPLEYGKELPKLTFFSTIDLLLRRGGEGGYQAARVQLADTDAHGEVITAIEEKGVYAASFREQFSQLERLFVIVDLALGIVGFIALLVATFGIANTMMMNVMERRREIGVMKAVGGDETDLQLVFVAESGMLGLMGGVLGVLGGFAVMAGIQAAIAHYMQRLSLPVVEAFFTSATMVFGAIAVALLVSLLAGYFPARRASRIEPVEALRSL